MTMLVIAVKKMMPNGAILSVGSFLKLRMANHTMNAKKKVDDMLR